jgi:hypothetical protein
MADPLSPHAAPATGPREPECLCRGRYPFLAHHTPDHCGALAYVSGDPQAPACSVCWTPVPAPALPRPEEPARFPEAPGTPLRELIDRSYSYMKKGIDGWVGAEGLVREAFALGRALSAPPPGEESGPMTWGVSTDEESFHGHYATKEEALAAAQSELALAPGQRFWVGGGHLYRPTRSVDVDALLDRLADDAGDACGDVAEGWPDPGTMARIALEKELHATVLRVLQRTGNLPAFYCCETTKEHTYQPALRAALREDEKGAKP